MVNVSMKDKSLYLTITQVLYPFSGLKNIDSEIVKNAADRGTVVHKICDSIAYKLPIFDDWIDELIKEYARNEEHFQKEKLMVLSFVESFQGWSEGKNFIKKPERFFFDDLMITGECDFIYKDKDEKLVLVDIKTPASESKTWMLQGSAYSYMAKSLGYNIEGIEFIQLSRSGGKPKIYKYRENFDLFQCALDMYKYFYKDATQENALDYI